MHACTGHFGKVGTTSTRYRTLRYVWHDINPIPPHCDFIPSSFGSRSFSPGSTPRHTHAGPQASPSTLGILKLWARMNKSATPQNEVPSNSDATASGGRSPLPAPTHTSAGGRRYRLGRGKKSRAGDFSRSSPVYKSLTGDTYTSCRRSRSKAVDGFLVPAGVRRKGARQAWFMYSIGVYVETIDEKTAPCFTFCTAYQDKYQIIWVKCWKYKNQLLSNLIIYLSRYPWPIPDLLCTCTANLCPDYVP